MSEYTIDVRTVPSNWSRALPPVNGARDWPPTSVWYRRVVGLECEDGKLLWDASARQDPEGTYDRATARPERMPVNNAVHQRLSSFFKAHMADPAANQWGFNCHYFAAQMCGSQHAAGLRPELGKSDWDVKVPVEVFADLSLQPEGTALALGRWAMTGARVAGKAHTTHSVIGLGEAHPDCLQVMGWGGHLGLEAYPDTMSDQLLNARLFADISNAGQDAIAGFGMYA